MGVDWTVIGSWGLQVPGMAIAVIGTISIVIICLKYNRTIVGDFRDTIKTSQKQILDHQRLMRELASEDSRQLRDALNASNQILGRACEVLDRHEDIVRSHEEMIREYQRQQATGEKT